MKKKKLSREDLIVELKELLLADNNTESDGILALAGRTLSGDLAATKIGRIKELLERI